MVAKNGRLLDKDVRSEEDFRSAKEVVGLDGGELLTYFSEKFWTLPPEWYHKPLVERDRLPRPRYDDAVQKFLKAFAPHRSYHISIPFGGRDFDTMGRPAPLVIAYVTELFDGIQVDGNYFIFTLYAVDAQILSIAGYHEIDRFDRDAKAKITRDQAIDILRQYVVATNFWGGQSLLTFRRDRRGRTALLKNPAVKGAASPVWRTCEVP